MLVIPTQSAENSYVPPPWVVSYSIFGLFILEDWQVDLQLKTPSCTHWSITFSGHSCHGQLLGTSITFLIKTHTHPRRRQTTRSVSRNLWSSLLSASSTTSTSMLRVSISLFKSTITHITISCLHFGSIFFQAPHLLFNVVCCGGVLGCLSFSPGAFCSPGLSSLFHNSICNNLVTFLHSIYSCLYLHRSPLTFFVFPKGSPPLSNHCPKNKIASPGARTTASVIHSSRPSWINQQTTPCMGRWGLATSSLP